MATTATLVLSATATLALPQPSCASTHRSTAKGLGLRSVQSQWAGRQSGMAQGETLQGGRRRGAVVCEVAVELGGSRGSEEGEERKAGPGTKVRVLGPLKVYHVPKHPELDVGGMEGEVKDVVTTFKGKPVSATFPYKVQLVTTGEEGRKFFVHLKEDEFEVVE